MKIDCSLAISYEAWGATNVLKHRIADYHVYEKKIDNIFAAILADNVVVAEIMSCRGLILPEYKKYLAEFEGWICQKSENKLTGVDQYIDQLPSIDERDIYLVYDFSRPESLHRDLREIDPDKLIDFGRQYDNVILQRGQNLGILCYGCGVPAGHRHELGCPFEQCPSCDSLWATCSCKDSCSSLKELGYYIMDTSGIRPCDDMRIRFGDENYSKEDKELMVQEFHICNWSIWK